MEPVRLASASPPDYPRYSPRQNLAVFRNTRADPALCRRVAALIRDAYLDSDPFRALPAPDGAFESAEGIAAHLAGGGEIWTAELDGRLVAGLRTHIAADGSWSLSRVGVARRCTGRGLGVALLDAVERGAAAASVPRVDLEAVIERCVPPYYLRLGYRSGDYSLATDDKLLTEVCMSRDPATSRRPGPVYELGRTRVTGTICWLLHEHTMTAVGRLGELALDAVVRHARRLLGQLFPAAEPPKLAGIDGWRGPADEFCDVFLSLPGGRTHPAGWLRQFTGGRAEVLAHQLPRRHHRSLWALQRFTPGFEPPLPS